jgi:hypothetical protein
MNGAVEISPIFVTDFAKARLRSVCANQSFGAT